MGGSNISITDEELFKSMDISDKKENNCLSCGCNLDDLGMKHMAKRCPECNERHKTEEQREYVSKTNRKNYKYKKVDIFTSMIIRGNHKLHLSRISKIQSGI